MVRKLTDTEKTLVENLSNYLKVNDFDGFYKAILNGAEETGVPYIDACEYINHITDFFVETCGIDVLKYISELYPYMFFEVNIGKNLVIDGKFEEIPFNCFMGTPVEKVTLKRGALASGGLGSDAFSNCAIKEWHEEESGGGYPVEGPSYITSSNIDVYMSKDRLEKLWGPAIPLDLIKKNLSERQFEHATVNIKLV